MCSHFLHGWRFWSSAGEETAKPTKAKVAKAKNERVAKKPAKPKAAPKKGKAKSAKPKKGKAAQAAAQAAAQSDASYGCGVCPETFPTLQAATEHALTHTS